jgi:hypothetical protein
MTGSTSSPLRLLVALTTGILIILLTVILLPFLFVFWLTYWLPHELDALSRAAVPSPTEAVQCQAGDVEKEEIEQVFGYTAYLPEWWWN